MTDPPLISIITPSLNQGRYIRRCVESVATQEYPHFEHIVVDGGSSDETLNILGEYSHLRCISEEDSGQADAINKGLRMAQGEIIGWLNSDDEYTAGTFQLVAERAVEKKCNSVLAGGVRLLYQGKCLRIQHNRPRKFFRYLNPWLPFTNFSQPGLFIPRTIMEDVGDLDEKLDYVMDFDLFCRILRGNYQICSLGKVVAHYHIHGACKTGKGWANLYPEWDKVTLRYARDLDWKHRIFFWISFNLLLPIVRWYCRMFYPPVF